MPMANTEPRDYRETLHCLLAFRRRKDNETGPVMCFREIVRDEPTDLERLKVRCRTVPGNWRIHRTVNARNVANAANVLMHRLIDNPKDAEALETVWKTCLLQASARGERNVLIDVDDPERFHDVVAALGGANVAVGSVVATPSGGYHIVCPKFDAREIVKIPDVSIQKDGYVFLEEFTVE
jgi:hypothetical protein